MLSPDGGHQVRLTRDGAYSTPSQDDGGRVYAVQRGRFVRLTRRGRRVGAPFGAAVGRSGNVTAYGPWEAQVSPDGSRIAYWRGVQRLSAPAGGLTPYDLEDQVVISRSDRFTPDSTFGYQRDYRDPSWIGNRELLVFNYGLGVDQAAFFAPKPAGDRPGESGSATPMSRRSATASCRATAACWWLAPAAASISTTSPSTG